MKAFTSLRKIDKNTATVFLSSLQQYVTMYHTVRLTVGDLNSKRRVGDKYNTFRTLCSWRSCANTDFFLEYS